MAAAPSTPAVTHGSGKVPGQVVRGDDPLPTQEALDWVKAEAWRRCCLKAFGLGWPVGEAGLAIVQLTPGLALEALSRLTPAVARGRLATCLRLAPQDAEQLVNRGRTLGPWFVDQAIEIFELLNGEG